MHSMFNEILNVVCFQKDSLKKKFELKTKENIKSLKYFRANGWLSLGIQKATHLLNESRFTFE